MLLVAGIAYADPPLSIPRAERAPRYDAERDRVTAAAVGAPGAAGRMSAARMEARRTAVEHAAAAVHRWADDAMARVRLRPRHAARVHASIDDAAEVLGYRPLVDGGAVALLQVPGAALRGAHQGRGLPWTR